MISEKHLEAIKKVLNMESQRDPFRRYAILAMQIADVGECIEYMKAYPKDVAIFKVELKTSLSDLLAQTLVMAVLYDINPNEMLELGILRLEEFKKKGGFKE